MTASVRGSYGLVSSKLSQQEGASVVLSDLTLLIWAGEFCVCSWLVIIVYKTCCDLWEFLWLAQGHDNNMLCYLLRQYIYFQVKIVSNFILRITWKRSRGGIYMKMNPSAFLQTTEPHFLIDSGVGGCKQNACIGILIPQLSAVW